MTDEQATLEAERPVRVSRFGRWFPIRYLYLRSGDDVRAIALTPGRQILGLAAGGALALWTLIASGGGPPEHVRDAILASVSAFVGTTPPRASVAPILARSVDVTRSEHWR